MLHYKNIFKKKKNYNKRVLCNVHMFWTMLYREFLHLFWNIGKCMFVIFVVTFCREV